MKLTLDDVARRLGLPPNTIERWIRQGRIPVQRRGSTLVFDRKELEAWARAHRLDLSPEGAPAAPAPAVDPDSLVACLRRGGVHYGVPGHDAPSVLAAAVDLVPVVDAARPRLLEALIEREELSSTGIGNGVAIPHPRSPLPDLAPRTLVTTCFLAAPAAFESIDAIPVFAVFVLLSPSVKVHLHNLSRLAFCLRSNSFIATLAERPQAECLFDEVSRIEARLEGPESG